MLSGGAEANDKNQFGQVFDNDLTNAALFIKKLQVAAATGTFLRNLRRYLTLYTRIKIAYHE